MTARILIVDDERIYSQSIAICLAAKGYVAITQEGGIAALDYLKGDDAIDLILLDLMMPDMYGLDVLRALKDNAKLKNIPVILQTGIQDEEEIKKGIEMGAISCVKKPFLIKELFETIADVLANHAAMQKKLIPEVI